MTDLLNIHIGENFDSSGKKIFFIIIQSPMETNLMNESSILSGQKQGKTVS